ncbi:MAG: hypothetical protein KDM63_06195 [Verrucomicrobiae bacterium]|nr:hypothetical protein [Verrucomicrobiae bacterium]
MSLLLSPRIVAAGLALAALAMASPVRGQADYKKYFDEDNVPPVWELYHAGRYDICVQVCRIAEQRGQPAVDWRVIKFLSLAAMGDIDAALEEVDKLPISYPNEIPALMWAHDFYASLGKKAEAEKMLRLINEAALKLKREERSGPTQVALGRAALALGADPQTVMEQYFDPVKGQKPKTKDEIPPGLVEAHLAAGQLALDKSDFQRAAQDFNAALKFQPNNPDIRHGLAQAYAPSNQKAANDHLDRALEANPMHAPSLLQQAENLINAEEYAAAEERVDRVLSVNPKHPLAWAIKATIDNLARANAEAFETSRTKALEVWPENPEVDHTIGRILSRNYRFAEGAERQRTALEMAPGYLPAKLQLAHDFLRLGDEETAFKLAAEVSEADPYDVLSYNLTVLRDEIAKFVTLQSPDFTIRMPAREAEIYGDHAMAMLTEAKQVLCAKYGLELDHPVLVEFFPEQQDFAIRTFGNLGGTGILGACFGTVVTMNSPGGMAHSRNNWEATLWHEFCHVVTLSVTHNKMPRWLSEGISVYEELQRNPVWGQRMTQEYRKMILEDDALTPISELSGAFLNPESGEHLMFAYYQSMLVVKYLIDEYGIDSFRRILKDLADGVLINDAIARNTTDLAFLEEEFRQRTAKLAESLAPGVDWTQPNPAEVDPLNPKAVAAYLEKNPKSHWARATHTHNLLAEEHWEDAAASAEALIALYPEDTHGESGYVLAARAWRGAGDEAKEAAVLRRLAEQSSEAYSAYTRLMDLELDLGEWASLLENADRANAINPFLKQVHYCRGCAHEAQDQRKDAVNAFETLLALKPVNPSEVRFRLARLLKPNDEAKSKRYLLDSLAESPRYREALALLLEPASQDKETPSQTSSPKSTPPPATQAPPQKDPDTVQPAGGAPASSPKP